MNFLALIEAKRDVRSVIDEPITAPLARMV